MLIQTGDNVGIGGFIITGTTPKNVLIRGIGPSLTGFGVPHAVPDPVLELHGPGAFATITNNDWKQTQWAEIQATGIPPTHDLESAILATLSPGAYTAIVRGNGNTSGVALVEVYDLNQSVNSKLANLSTRAFVKTGDQVMIGGFMVGGSATDQTGIVVRAMGPSLSSFGIANALQDPMLSLYDSNGNMLGTNDNWREASQPEIVAAGLAPTDDREAALFQSLPPGAYTAIVAGKGSTTGVGLVEAYNIQ